MKIELSKLYSIVALAEMGVFPWIKTEKTKKQVYRRYQFEVANDAINGDILKAVYIGKVKIMSGKNVVAFLNNKIKQLEATKNNAEKTIADIKLVLK